MPLSLTIIFGAPRLEIRSPSSRTTRLPEIDVSTTAARHSRVTSSTMLSTRNRRPVTSWSCTKSRLQRWFGQRQHRRRRPRANGAPSSLPAPDRQPLLAVEPLGLLAVDRDAVPAKQDVQASIAEPPALLRQLAQTSTAGRHHHPGTSDTACSCDPPRRQHTPAARSSPTSSGDARPLAASRRALPFF